MFILYTCTFFIIFNLICFLLLLLFFTTLVAYIQSCKSEALTLKKYLFYYRNKYLTLLFSLFDIDVQWMSLLYIGEKALIWISVIIQMSCSPMSLQPVRCPKSPKMRYITGIECHQNKIVGYFLICLCRRSTKHCWSYSQLFF